MKWEDSPPSGKLSFAQSVSRSISALGAWLYRRRRKLLLLLGAVLLLDILVFAFIMLSDLTRTEAGGLNGCLVTAEGDPVAATLTIATASVQTYADGCFLFSALPPGPHILVIATQDETLRHTVTITAGQAVNLGTIVVNP